MQGGINGNYLNGINITVNTPTSRTHVWSLVAGHTSDAHRPTFVGNNLACETSPHCDEGVLCGPLLWKSQQYGTNVSYSLNNLLLPHVSDIEVRVC